MFTATPRATGIAFATALFALAAGPAGAITTIDFDDLSHGQVLAQDGHEGVDRLRARNNNQDFDFLSVGFDTNRSNTASPDLEAGPSGFSGGNLQGVDLGTSLILQGNDTGCADGFCDDPLADATSIPGRLSIQLEDPIQGFRLDVINVQDDDAYGGIAFFREGVRVGNLFWEDVEDEDVDGLGEIEFGENSANRLPFTWAADFGVDAFDWIIVVYEANTAIDNLEFVHEEMTDTVQFEEIDGENATNPVPEPGAALLFATGLGVIGARRRSRP